MNGHIFQSAQNIISNSIKFKLALSFIKINIYMECLVTKESSTMIGCLKLDVYDGLFISIGPLEGLS